MRAVTATEKLRAVNEGQMSKDEFVRQMRQQHPNHISAFNGFEDSVQILRNRGLLFEAKSSKKAEKPDAYSKRPETSYSIEDLERGIRFELAKAGLKQNETPTPEAYDKAKAASMANLEKDRLFYLTKLTKDGKNPESSKPTEVKRGELQKDTPNDLERVKLQEMKTRVLKSLIAEALAEVRRTYPEVSKELLREFYNEKKSDIISEKNVVGLFEAYVESKSDVATSWVVPKDKNYKNKNKYKTKDNPKHSPDFISKIQSKEADLQRLKDIFGTDSEEELSKIYRDEKGDVDPQEANVKPDYLDLDGDGDKKETMKKAAKEKQEAAEEVVKEAVKKVIRAVLTEQTTINEAATKNLSKFSDAYSDQYQGVTPLINQLENIVTEVEGFYAKTAEKLQNIFDSVADLQTPEGTKVGTYLAPTIEQAFQKDIAPVQAKGFMSSVRIPKSPSADLDIPYQNLEEEEIEEKQTLFKPAN